MPSAALVPKAFQEGAEIPVLRAQHWLVPLARKADLVPPACKAHLEKQGLEAAARSVPRVQPESLVRQARKVQSAQQAHKAPPGQ